MKILPRCAQCRLHWQRWAAFPSRDLKNLQPPWHITLPFCLVVPDEQSVQRAVWNIITSHIPALGPQVPDRCARGRQLHEQATHMVLYGDSSYLGKDSQAPVAITPGNQGKKKKLHNIYRSIQIFCLLGTISFVKWCFALFHIVHVYIFINTSLYVYTHTYIHPLPKI